jgi:hypothetical protein
MNPLRLTLVCGLLGLEKLGVVLAGDPVAAAVPRTLDADLKPLAPGEVAVSTHGPFLLCP